LSKVASGSEEAFLMRDNSSPWLGVVHPRPRPYTKQASAQEVAYRQLYAKFVEAAMECDGMRKLGDMARSYIYHRVSPTYSGASLSSGAGVGFSKAASVVKGAVVLADLSDDLKKEAAGQLLSKIAH